MVLEPFGHVRHATHQIDGEVQPSASSLPAAHRMQSSQPSLNLGAFAQGMMAALLRGWIVHHLFFRVWNGRTRNLHQALSQGTDLLPIFLPTVFTRAFLPPLGGMVRIWMMILSNRDHKEQEGAGRSRKEQEGAAAAEVLQSAIIRSRSSFSVKFVTDWIQRNPFLLYNPGTICGPSGALPATSAAHLG